MSTAPPPPPDAYEQTAPVQPRPTNGMAIAALVCGLLSVPLFLTIIGGILLGLAAIILGVLGVRFANAHRGSGKGMAITGIVSGLLGLLLSVLAIAGLNFLGNQIEENPEILESIEEQLGTELPSP